MCDDNCEQEEFENECNNEKIEQILAEVIWESIDEFDEEVGGTCGYMWLKALNKVQGWIIDSLHNKQSIHDNDPIDYNLN